jgi:DNA-directed RNA polymerase subunit RPC12/RpoP
MSFKKRRWDEDEKILDLGIVPPDGSGTPDSNGSAGKDDDDEIRCKYCGSTSWTDISVSERDAYWCGNCGAKFNVEAASKEIEDEIEHLKLQKVKDELWGTTWRKIVTVGSFFFLGLLVLRVVSFAFRAYS